MPKIETNTRKIVGRLERDGWVNAGGGSTTFGGIQTSRAALSFHGIANSLLASHGNSQDGGLDLRAAP